MAVYVHDWPTWQDWSSGAGPARGELLLTESPLVWERLTGAGFRLEGLADLIPADDLTRLADLADEVNDAWEQTLDAVLADLFPGIRTGYALRHVTLRVLHNMFYKGRLLAEVVRRYGPVTVPYQAGRPHNDLGSSELTQAIVIQGCNYLALVAQAGGGDGRVELTSLNGAEHPPRRAGLSSPRPGSRLLAQALRLTAMPAATMLYRPLTALSRLGRAGSPDRTVLCYEYNHLANAAAWGLWQRGWRVRFFHPPAGRAEFEIAPTEREGLVTALLPADAIDRAGRLDVAPALEAAARRTVNYLTGPVAGRILFLSREADRILADQGAGPGTIFLSNDLYDPVPRCLGQVFERRGLVLVGFAHGCLGRSRLHQRFHRSSPRDLVRAHVDYTEADGTFYRRIAGDSGQPIHVQGTRQVYRAAWPRLSRWLARRLWRLPPEPTLVFAPTFFARDNTYLVDEVKDLAYWFLLKKVLREAIGPSRRHTVLKIYAKGESDLLESDFGAACVADLPPNVRIEAEPPFPLSRFAADLLLIDRPESTLEWALSCGVPLIFLNHRFAPVNPEVRPQMEAAMFFIDAFEEGWIERLRDLLSLPLAELVARWEAMAPARQEYNQCCALGPDRPIRDMVKFVTGLARETREQWTRSTDQ